jgi:hypothetical protein
MVSSPAYTLTGLNRSAWAQLSTELKHECFHVEHHVRAALYVIGDLDRAIQADVEGIFRGSAKVKHSVVTLAAVESIVTEIAHQQVTASFPIEGIVAAKAADRVVAGATLDKIHKVVAEKLVIAGDIDHKPVDFSGVERCFGDAEFQT